ncbi:domain found in IF2B/IF5-domain-containing protein [Tricharina praecox]|uniref:domain found in IF2B/IF5-domain-containing protein n=1 Tax=Tricharina praecox TaxID=43433 RepID=UPI00221FF0C0|nr:domain found in IF2B/IF5-domain-containing protein [Tricharina praecox]KAI5859190.1 domain found in IF2B/IF5-domain-containing protein [Tricharina praecox]
MSDTEEAPIFDPSKPKIKTRKSVAFEEGEDANGGETTTAQSHSIVDDAEADPEVDELTEQLKDLKKKKKKKVPAADANGDEAPAGDGEFDPALMKKKKKKKAPKEAAVDSFDAQLAEAGVISRDEDNDEAAEEAKPEDIGDLIAGTGVWNSASTVDLTYPLLLTRFFTLLRNQHPDLAGDGRRNYKIPPPQVLREGNKKTIFANISDICKRMKRQDEHVTQFLFAELGTGGSVDGSKRLVIRGKFQQKQLENVLRRYILEYVTCRTCKSPDTDLKKGENRLFFVTCNSCGSRRSVATIKTGFQATIGKRRRQKV